MGNLGSAAMSDIGGRLSGTRTNRGYMGFRMAADLANRDASQTRAPTSQQSPPPDNTIRPS
jgi:hypothetical protein